MISMPTGESLRLDPRISIIEKRLFRIKHILVFASGKGGVGKSCCSSVAALLLARSGKRTGLLDFDFHGASDHLFLGNKLHFPEEEFGILPLETAFNLKFMSIAVFTGEHGVPMRGYDITNAILELLAVTIWGELDYLIVDMPPGIGDEVLDLIRFMERSEIIIVSSPSSVSVKIVKRLLVMFLELGMNVKGLIENMTQGDTNSSSSVRRLAEETNISFLGSLPYDDDLETAIGNPEHLVQTGFSETMGIILSEFFRDR